MFETMVFEALLLLASICILFFTLKRCSRKDSLFNQLPGPKNIPVIGFALELNIPTEDRFKYFLDLHKRFGERVVAYLLGLYFVILSSPADIEKLLTSTTNINKGTSYTLAKPWLSDSLPLSSGEKWHQRRKMFTSAFHFRILEDFMVVFNEQANILVDIFRKDFSDRKENDICPYLSRCALDVIGETSMGIKLDAQHHEATFYLAAVEKALQVGMYRALRPHFWSDFIFSLTPYGREHTSALKTLHDFTYKIIQEKKGANDNKLVPETFPVSDSTEVYMSRKRRVAFLDMLLEAQKDPENNLTDRDIREEVDVFMFAGHGTSSTSMSFTIFLLGCHPEYQVLDKRNEIKVFKNKNVLPSELMNVLEIPQAQLHDELDRIFRNDRTRPIVSKDLTEMKYLEMCIKESLRLFPIGALFSRLLTTDLVLHEEIRVPAGFDVVVNVLAVHRNDRIYPNPSEYRPDRFLPETVQSRHPFAFLPFSAGPRNCIGQKFAMMEMKVIIANLFRNFKVEAAESLEDVVPTLEGVTKPRDGLKVRILPRLSSASQS